MHLVTVDSIRTCLCGRRTTEPFQCLRCTHGDCLRSVEAGLLATWFYLQQHRKGTTDFTPEVAREVELAHESAQRAMQVTARLRSEELLNEAAS